MISNKFIGNNVLMRTIEYKYKEVMDVLTDAGAELNVETQRGLPY